MLSTERDPVYSYNTPGDYTIVLYAGNERINDLNGDGLFTPDERPANAAAISQNITVLGPQGTLGPDFWSPQNSGTSENLHSIKAIDENVVWASGETGTILKTTDGGSSWELFPIPNTALNCYSIDAINSNIAWVVATNPSGGESAIYKTINGGATWELKHSSNTEGSYYNAIRFYDENNGMFYGDPEDVYFAIYTSDDGGEKWERTDSVNIPSIHPDGEYGISNSLAIYGNHAWFGTFNPNYNDVKRILHSSDRGKTWEAYSNNMDGVGRGINSIEFYNENDGVLVRDNNIIQITHDGGNTWTFPPTLYTYPALGICYINSNSIMVVGVNSGSGDTSVAVASTDGGTTWFSCPISSTITRTLRDVTFANNSQGWAVGADGVILKWIGGEFPE
jgi:photosystem II stability/assembly factor-like uncharacterized protein